MYLILYSLDNKAWTPYKTCRTLAEANHLSQALDEQNNKQLFLRIEFIPGGKRMRKTTIICAIVTMAIIGAMILWGVVLLLG